MWFTVELFGFTVLAIGVGQRRKERWITNTDGHFEIAPDVEYEYEEDDTESEWSFGFR